MVLLKTTIITVRTLLQYNQISKKMVDGHVSDLSATILFPFLKKGKILGIKVGVLAEKRATSQGMWVLGSGIEIPVIIHIYGIEIHIRHVRKNDA